MPSTKVYPGYPAIHPKTVAEVALGGSLSVSVNSVAGVATATVVIAGTTGSGPTVTVTINGHGVTYTYVAGDTSATIAAGHIAAAINADATDLLVVSAANNSSATITITALNSGSAGMLSLATSVTGGATATASGTELDLANNYVIAKATQNVLIQNQPYTLYQDFLYQVDSATKTALRAAGVVY